VILVCKCATAAFYRGFLNLEVCQSGVFGTLVKVGLASCTPSDGTLAHLAKIGVEKWSIFQENLVFTGLGLNRRRCGWVDD
jgi:hypothetical protein